jgi:hypothetical protein
MALPDIANLGDPGHIADHNLLISEIAAKSPSASPVFTGTADFTGATVLGIATGLAYITKADFSASSAVIVNGCFTSEFDHYRVVLTLAGSTVAALNMRWRVGGVDNSAASYTRQRQSANATTVDGNQLTAQSSGQIANINTEYLSLAADVYRPALAVPTSWVGAAAYGVASPQIEFFNMGHTATTAFDGISLLPSVGTITGSLYIFGYRKA